MLDHKAKFERIFEKYHLNSTIRGEIRTYLKTIVTLPLKYLAIR